MNDRRRPSRLRGYAKQLAAEIIGDQPLQEDGREEVREAALEDEDRSSVETGARPAGKSKGDDRDGTL